MSMVSRSLLASLVIAAVGCKADKPKDTPPPPPPPPVATATAGLCADGGGELTDATSAPFFPKSVAGYCVDPQGEVKTYGEKGKLSMDEVCTTAFDGECEVYKRFGLKRVVSLRYVDGSGKGGSVEVNLSQFADVPGAYGMYTLRVVADDDPVDPSTPKVLAAEAAGAIGTGRAYVWRGEYLVELQYVNENESPAELAKSSEAVLTKAGKEIGARLPGAKTLPPSASALPEEHRVPNGIAFAPKDLFAWHAIGPAAMGFYKDGDKRWRVVSIVKADAEQAKDAFKTIRTKPGALPVPNVGDEAAHVIIVGTGDQAKTGPKPEFVFARKGNVIWGVGDEEYALREAKGAAAARITKDDAIAKLKPLLAKVEPAAPSPGQAVKPSASSAPAASAK